MSMTPITPLMPVYPRCDVRPVRGEGCYLIGERGERYLDFASGIAVNILGHGHPHLVQAIQQQAATLMHVSNLYGSPQGESLAQRLVDNTFADTVFFTNSWSARSRPRAAIIMPAEISASTSSSPFPTPSTGGRSALFRRPTSPRCATGSNRCYPVSRW